MIYQPKKDLLPTIMVWSGTAFMLTLAATIAAFELPGNDPSKYGVFALGLVPLTLWGVLAVWPILSTSYEITSVALIIRFGPIRTTIPLEQIVQVKATKAWSGIAWNKIWSFDRLLIYYRLPSGRTPLPVAISPANKDAFLDELKAASAGVNARFH